MDTSKCTIPEAVARLAESRVGVRESGGANKGPRLQEFFDADNYDPNGPKPGDDGYAWCAAFVCWAVYQAVKDRRVSFKRPTTPGAWDFERWAREQDSSVRLRAPHGGDIKRGDILVFKHSHIGIAVSDANFSGAVKTVEGNTNDSGGREGDGVYARTRKLSEIRSRIRFTEEGKP
jgi:hypothetical protein